MGVKCPSFVLPQYSSSPVPITFFFFFKSGYKVGTRSAAHSCLAKPPYLTKCWVLVESINRRLLRPKERDKGGSSKELFALWH